MSFSNLIEVQYFNGAIAISFFSIFALFALLALIWFSCSLNSWYLTNNFNLLFLFIERNRKPDLINYGIIYGGLPKAGISETFISLITFPS
ncbi:Uncharacterized protein XB15_01374 [Leptospira santarosai]|nr:Uncharacterized protein XB15_01374 [Leptospira santarosai]